MIYPLPPSTRRPSPRVSARSVVSAGPNTATLRVGSASTVAAARPANQIDDTSRRAPTKRAARRPIDRLSIDGPSIVVDMLQLDRRLLGLALDLPHQAQQLRHLNVEA